MSKGFLIFAQDTEDVCYIKQAYALALSIKSSQHNIKNVSLVTSDIVPEKYKHPFDQIIPIPWYTEQSNSTLAAEHRWKMYYASPYDETIVLDADMLVLEDISTWWDQCSPYDIKFCSRIKNYKLETVVDTTYRKTFIANELFNPYSALHYFKKSEQASTFYKVLEFVCNNWEWCWTTFAPKEYQQWLSLDLAVAITAEITGCYDVVGDSCSPLEFIHMKPALQGWPLPFGSWQDGVHYVFTSQGNMVVGNIKQSKIFHYVEKEFLTDSMITVLEALVNNEK